MKISLPLALSTTVLASLATLLAARPPVQDEIAPFVVPEGAIYGLQLSHPTRELFPTLRPIDPVKILGTQGRWALVGFQGLTRGPIWLNFDHVISYRTDP